MQAGIELGDLAILISPLLILSDDIWHCLAQVLNVAVYDPNSAQ